MSPGKVEKVDGYKGTWGGKTVAKSTTKVKAESQQRLLRGIEHGNWRPTGQPSKLAKAIVKKSKSKRNI